LGLRACGVLSDDALKTQSRRHTSLSPLAPQMAPSSCGFARTLATVRWERRHARRRLRQISGTFHAADVTGGAAAMGLEAGNLAELIAGIRAGATCERSLGPSAWRRSSRTDSCARSRAGLGCSAQIELEGTAKLATNNSRMSFEKRPLPKGGGLTSQFLFSVKSPRRWCVLACPYKIMADLESRNGAVGLY
jgi:hypothetical protein